VGWVGGVDLIKNTGEIGERKGKIKIDGFFLAIGTDLIQRSLKSTSKQIWWVISSQSVILLKPILKVSLPVEM